jgi:hypothetical protein
MDRTTHVPERLLSTATALALALTLGGCSCSSDPAISEDGSIGPDSAAPDDGAVADDAPAADGTVRSDALVPAGCTPGSTECSDCIDNDGDGRADGFDPECTSAADDREDSFATGIPGDNIDDVFQDCFFDGNSGHEDDGCQIPTCCIRDPSAAGCPPAVPPTLSCTPSAECAESCRPLTTPGCDCFGCCTICQGSECHTIITNPAIAPDCTLDRFDDPTVCPTCTLIEECSTPCGGCVLCPGQDPSDLPPDCTETECPSGRTVCTTTDDCAADEYCSVGCCVAGGLI